MSKENLLQALTHGRKVATLHKEMALGRIKVAGISSIIGKYLPKKTPDPGPMPWTVVPKYVGEVSSGLVPTLYALPSIRSQIRNMSGLTDFPLDLATFSVALPGALALSELAGKGLGKLMPKAKRWEEAITKTSALSRAAKGALIAPVAALAAGPILKATGMGDDLANILAKYYPDNMSVPSVPPLSYGPLKLVKELGGLELGIKPSKALIPGLALASGLGAGAGKLSEKIIPVAKKSLYSKLMEDPTKRNIALAAAMFPWISTTAGLTYLATRGKDSDS